MNPDARQAVANPDPNQSLDLNLAEPPVRVDGLIPAVTVDLGIDNDLSDMGTGIGDRNWTQARYDLAAARVAADLPADRVERPKP